MSRSRRGFTLGELMIVVVIIGVLASIAVPQFNRTVRRGRLRAARDVLLTMFAGERTFQAQNNSYQKVLIQSPNATWLMIFMDNPNLAGNSTGISFDVADPTATTFTARACVPGAGPLGAVACNVAGAQLFMTIDQDNSYLCNPTPPPPYTAADCPP